MPYAKSNQLLHWYQVNNVDFTNIIREEAVLFLLDLPKGEEVTILAQKKKDGKYLYIGSNVVNCLEQRKKYSEWWLTSGFQEVGALWRLSSFGFYMALG